MLILEPVSFFLQKKNKQKLVKMFTKPFRIKSNSQMKGSDKKKFKSDIRKRFPYFTDPDVDQDLLNDLIPNKEELIVTKIETHNGDYVLLYQQKQKNTTLFFELEKEKIIFPTLYTLWQCPSMLPTMTTMGPVVQKLANGNTDSQCWARKFKKVKAKKLVK